jgi:hypothetical protein
MVCSQRAHNRRSRCVSAPYWTSRPQHPMRRDFKWMEATASLLMTFATF